ncbi:hypothetical protein BOW43_12295 [Solemya velum gill symbiont]|nr:hypothetical protein BOW43_12295 [Solemya velum gill symbiont]
MAMMRLFCRWYTFDIIMIVDGNRHKKNAFGDSEINTETPGSESQYELLFEPEPGPCNCASQKQPTGLSKSTKSWQHGSLHMGSLPCFVE